MSKLNRVRTGCWTCKQRHRKCDEGKPECLNCTKSKRKCEGYDLRLCFDVDDKRNKNRKNGTAAYGFIGRPKMHKVVKKEDKPSRSNDKEIPLNQAFPLVQANQMANTSSTTLTPGTIPPTKLSNDTFQQLSFELFEDLEYLLNNPSGEMPEETIPSSYEMNSKRSNLDASPHTGHNLPKIFSAASTTTVSEISHGNTLFDSPVPGVATPMGADPADTDLKLTYQEENMMLKHFFQKLLPLLDAHPNSPWPDLALKYCDFNIARSCFISLACMHLYESKKNQSRNPRDAFEAVYERGAYSPDSDFNYDLNTLQEYYKKGMQHINSTMESLVNFVNENAGSVISSSVDKKRQISAFVILLLINVHILFTVLEEGKSASVRFYFKVFSSICNDKHFFDNVVRENDKKKSLVVVLSWYDTVCAVVSPDCRLPVCSEEWYGTSTNSDMKHNPDDIDSHRNEETFRTDLANSQNESYANGTTITGISTAKMMGCPGQIFRAMARVCYIRHVLHYNKPYGGIHADYEEIKQTLVNYRDYVVFDIDENVETSEAFSSSLRAAQCWSLAVYITLERTVKFPSSQVRIRQLVNEFIDTYSGMDPLSPLVTQMVWPVYAVGCECRSPYEQSRLLQFMDTLYRNVKMGTLFSLRHIVQSVWESGITQEEYLRQWLPKDVDYLPL